MTIEKFKQIMLTNEPLLTYKGNIDYQVCVVNGKYLFGLADSENEDVLYDTLDDLIENHKIDGIPFKQAIKDLEF